jgi:hypothetical protein
MDGGIKYNNPIEIADRERKCIWPELENRDPDILLSIGTGHKNRSGGYPEKIEKPSKVPSVHRGIAYANSLLQLATDTLEDSMDSEKIWNNFLDASLRGSDEDLDRKDKQRKYYRINPELDHVPRLDQGDRIEELQSITRNMYANSPEAKCVAATLVASLFYLEEEPERRTNLPETSNVQKYSGKRYPLASEMLRTE